VRNDRRGVVEETQQSRLPAHDVADCFTATTCEQLPQLNSSQPAYAFRSSFLAPRIRPSAQVPRPPRRYARQRATRRGLSVGHGGSNST